MESKTIYRSAQELFNYSQRFRREFHRAPELGFKEFKTSQIIAEELRSIGYRVKTGIADTGVKAMLGKGGPVILLRFDMDALPIEEENDIPYRSENPGVMHACGHDGHMAIGLTVAKLLKQFSAELTGTVILDFQPAEEGLGGCERMIDEGILANPKPDAAFGVHIWNEKPLGWIGLKQGAMMAGADIFHVVVTGGGGHGALPQATRDPVTCTAHIVTVLQTIVSRNISALDSGVVSVTKMKAGETFNVIPAQAEFSGTARFFEKKVHKIIEKRFFEIVTNVARSMGCGASIDYKSLTPALQNSEIPTKKVLRSITDLKLPHVVDNTFQTMGSEDFAFILEKIPGCFFFLGSADKKAGLTYGHHHPRFNFSEEVMTDAAAIMVETVLNF